MVLKIKKRIIIIGIIIFSYIVSYSLLSRYSLVQNEELGIIGFYYVPCDPSNINNYELQNNILKIFYAPIWLLDYYLLNGPLMAGLPSDL